MPLLGDTVVYRYHVCTVERVREAYYEGEDYLELRALFGRSLKLYVAVAKAQPPAFRPIMTRAQALAIIDSIADAGGVLESAAEPNASTRTLAERQAKEEYERLLRSLSPEGLASVLKTAHERASRRVSRGQNITAVDKKYLELAEKLLCDELSVSLDMPRDEVPSFLYDQTKWSAGA